MSWIPGKIVNNTSFILFSFREFHGGKEEDIAAGLSITLEEYKSLESGTEKVDAEVASKLSKLYKAPPQIFLASNCSDHLSIIYSHCHFEHSNGYVNHLYNDNESNLKVEILQQLKDEISRLRNQNDMLLKSLLELR